MSCKPPTRFRCPKMPTKNSERRLLPPAYASQAKPPPLHHQASIVSAGAVPSLFCKSAFSLSFVVSPLHILYIRKQRDSSRVFVIAVLVLAAYLRLMRALVGTWGQQMFHLVFRCICGNKPGLGEAWRPLNTLLCVIRVSSITQISERRASLCGHGGSQEISVRVLLAVRPDMEHGLHVFKSAVLIPALGG